VTLATCGEVGCGALPAVALIANGRDGRRSSRAVWVRASREAQAACRASDVRGVRWARVTRLAPWGLRPDPHRARGEHVSHHFHNRYDQRRNALLQQRAREMRVAGTASERLLWQCLVSRKLGVAFRRQYVIGGRIADFAAPSLRLVVEVDGSSHVGRRRADARRDRELARLGPIAAVGSIRTRFCRSLGRCRYRAMRRPPTIAASLPLSGYTDRWYFLSALRSTRFLRYAFAYVAEVVQLKYKLGGRGSAPGSGHQPPVRRWVGLVSGVPGARAA
jgi:very-short-patch-repair endonuclease